MEIKVIENDNIISQTKYWNGTTISNISEYSTKIPGYQRIMIVVVIGI